MKFKTRDIVLMAMYITLFYVLDTFINTLPIFQMPNGGSLGLATVALLLCSYHMGWQKGLIVAIISVFVQFITGPMYTPDLLGFLLDYLLAFSVYGIACIFPNYKYFYSGVLITNLIRFVCSTISGVIVWGVDWWGSIIYQAQYMLPTIILTMIVVPLLHKILKPYMK